MRLKAMQVPSVARSHKPAPGLKKGGSALLFLCLSAGLHAQAPEPPREAGAQSQAQAQFEAAVQSLFAGQHEEAMARFKALYLASKAPRVKLEWARAAFLAKHYELSATLFNEVLAEPIPDIVKFNISIYLGEIAKLGDQTDYGFTFTRDTNPFAVARPQQVLIYGIPFTYTPPKTQETLAGLNFCVSHARSLTRNGTLRLIAEADDTEYQGQDNNKSAVKLALQFKPTPADNLSFRAGVDHYFQRRELLLKQPYVSVHYRKDQLAGVLNQYQVDARSGLNRYPDFAYVNGSFTSLGMSGARSWSNSLQVGGNVYLDAATSQTASQAYRTVAAGAYARFFTPAISSNTKLSFTRTSRTYKAIDELFIVKRSDDRDVWSASIQPYTLKIQGLYPAIEFGVERSQSNIPINSFRRSFFNFMLRKNY
jgi:hypothetical protein